MTIRDYEIEVKQAFYLCLILVVAVFLTGLIAVLKNEHIRQLQHEAFQRGYATFEPNENSGIVVFKWKETQKP